MAFKRKNISFPNKISFLCIFLFSIACLNVCAENKANTENANKNREAVVKMATKLIGSPYKYGAVGPSSFDCSGLVYYTFRTSIKMQLPRTASAIFSYTTQIAKEELQPGDLVFFKTSSSGKISHVGIYTGNDNFISAISDGSETGVVSRSLSDRYWNSKYFASGRVITEGTFETYGEQTEKNNSSANKKSNGFIAYLVDGCTFSTVCNSCSLLWP